MYEVDYYDQEDLLLINKIELNKIVKILNQNPTIEIELGSHTDCRSSEQYNLTLSDKRAKASATYIKSKIKNPATKYIAY